MKNMTTLPKLWFGRSTKKEEEEVIGPNQGDKGKDSTPKDVIQLRSGGFQREVATVQWEIAQFTEIGKISKALELQKITFEAGASLQLHSKFKAELGMWECKECKPTDEYPAFALPNKESTEHLIEEDEGSENKSKNYLMISLSRLGRNNYPRLFTKLKVAIFSKNLESKSYIRRSKAIDLGSSSSENKTICWKNLVEISTLLDPTAQLLDANGTLTIEMELTIFRFAEEAKVITDSSLEFHKDLIKTLQAQSASNAIERYNTLFALNQDKSFSDALLWSADEVSFPIHKAIVAVRCACFKNIFEGGVKPQDLNPEYQVTVKSDALRIILQHIYSGNLQVEWLSGPLAITRDVLAGATDYGLNALTDFYDQILHIVATVDNIDELMAIAQEHNLLNAVEHLEHIKKNLRKTPSENTDLATSSAQEVGNGKK